jgi:hypothetical protein
MVLCSPLGGELGKFVKEQVIWREKDEKFTAVDRD